MENGQPPNGRRKSDLETPPLLRILAVDDDAAYLRYLRHVLARAGFEVETATDGETAIEILRSDPSFALLLVDLAMPGMDGIETVAKFRESAEATELYTILLTANATSEAKLRALRNGFDDFLTKGESDEELVAKLRSAARRIDLEKQLHVANQRLHLMAYTDELTQVGNRRALMEAAEELAAKDQPYSVVLFDLDRFKAINDVHGHAMGDRVLADVATCLKSHTRTGDVLARYGGDEFVLLLGATPVNEAEAIAQRVCQAIAALQWTTDREVVRVTASWGCAMGALTLPGALQACEPGLARLKTPQRRLPSDPAPVRLR